MEFEDDAPPDLVDTAGAVEDEEADATFKVPITIVTGIIPNLLHMGPGD